MFPARLGSLGRMESGLGLGVRLSLRPCLLLVGPVRFCVPPGGIGARSPTHSELCHDRRVLAVLLGRNFSWPSIEGVANLSSQSFCHHYFRCKNTYILYIIFVCLWSSGLFSDSVRLQQVRVLLVKTRLTVRSRRCHCVRYKSRPLSQDSANRACHSVRGP